MPYTVNKSLIKKLQSDLEKVQSREYNLGATARFVVGTNIFSTIRQVTKVCIGKMDFERAQLQNKYITLNSKYGVVEKASIAFYAKNSDEKTISQWERAEAAEQKEQNIIAENKNKWEAIKNKPWYCFPQKIAGIFTCRNDMRNAQSRLRGIENWKKDNAEEYTGAHNDARQRLNDLKNYYDEFPEKRMCAHHGESQESFSTRQREVILEHKREVSTQRTATLHQREQVEAEIGAFVNEYNIELAERIDPWQLQEYERMVLDEIQGNDALLMHNGIVPAKQEEESPQDHQGGIISRLLHYQQQPTNSTELAQSVSGDFRQRITWQTHRAIWAVPQNERSAIQVDLVNRDLADQSRQQTVAEQFPSLRGQAEAYGVVPAIQEEESPQNHQGGIISRLLHYQRQPTNNDELAPQSVSSGVRQTIEWRVRSIAEDIPLNEVSAIQADLANQSRQQTVAEQFPSLRGQAEAFYAAPAQARVQAFDRE